MAYQKHILLGRITKTHGFGGAVTVKTEKVFSESIPGMESVFLEIEGRPVPFFISELEYSGADILKLTFTGYNSIDKIGEFAGCRVFLTTGLKENNKIKDIHILTGYQVFTSDDKMLGVIREIITNPGQMLLSVIAASKKEILIPLHEDFIVSIDKKKKTIIMDIPDGLTEIN